MKIHIITDLEGPAMVTNFTQTRDTTPESKAISMALLTGEVNACVDGILDFDPQAEVIVWDGHGSGGINLLDFHPKAKFLPCCHVPPRYGLGETYDALFFVGQHAMAGTPNAPLCHTYSSKTIEYYKINGVPHGEFGCRAIMVGQLGIPTVFLSGDDKAVEEAQALVPGLHGAVVKWGLGRECALSLSPKAAQELIRETAARACADIGNIPPVNVPPPYEHEIRVYEDVSVEGYLARPNAQQLDERTVLIRAKSIFELLV